MDLLKNRRKMRFSIAIWLLLTAFISIPISALQAQFAKWMPLSNKDQRLYGVRITGHDENGIYAFTEGYKTYSIKKYNFNLDELWSKRLIQKERTISIEKVLSNKVRSEVFYSTYIAGKKRHLLGLTVLGHALEAEEIDIPIFEINEVAWKNRSSFQILSNISNGIKCCLHQYEFSSDRYALQYKFINEQNASINAISISLSNVDYSYDIIESLMDTDGSVYTLVQIEDLNKRKAESGRFFFHVYQVQPNSLNFRYVRLDASNNYLNDARIKLDRFNDRLIVGGLYSPNTPYRSRGCYYAIIEKDSCQIADEYLIPFGGAINSKMGSLGEAYREKELDNLYIKDLVVRSDGGVLLLAEIQYTSRQNYIRYSVYYPIEREVIYNHFDEIVLMSINPAGTADFEGVIPKGQISQASEGLGSFVLITLGEKVAIIFNEDFRKDSNLLEFKVDNLGAIQPNRLLGMGTDNVLIFPDAIRQVSARTAIVPGIKRKRKGFLQITY